MSEIVRSIEDLTLELMESNERDEKTSVKIEKICDGLQKTIHGTFSIVSQIKKLENIFSDGSIKIQAPEIEQSLASQEKKEDVAKSKKEENDREDRTLFKQIADSLKGFRKDNDVGNLDDFKLDLSSIGSAIAGTFVGMAQLITTSIVAAGISAIKVVTMPFKWIADFAKKLSIFEKLKGIKLPKLKDAGIIRKIVTGLGNWVGKLANLGSGVLKAIKSAGNIGKTITGFFNGRVFKFFSSFASNILRPLYTLFAIFKNAKEDMAKEKGILGKLFGAFTGFVKGVLEGFITGILDLGKNIVAWVAGVFGFDGIKETLDSFSFTDSMKSAIDAIFSTEWIKSVYNWAKNAFKMPEMPDIDFNFGGILDDLKAAFDKVIDFFTSPIENLKNMFKGFFTGDTPEEKEALKKRNEVAANISNRRAANNKARISRAKQDEDIGIPARTKNDALVQDLVQTNKELKNEEHISNTTNKNGGGAVIAPTSNTLNNSVTTVNNNSQLSHSSQLALGS